MLLENLLKCACVLILKARSSGEEEEADPCGAGSTIQKAVVGRSAESVEEIAGDPAVRAPL